MHIYKFLKPHTHIFEVTGGTGDGKTELILSCANRAARRMMKKCIGRTNSTLKERLFVFSDAYTEIVIVAVKLGNDILDRTFFSEIITNALAKVVIAQGKVAASFVGKDEDDLEQFLQEEIERKNNSKAILHFLNQNQKEEFVKAVIEVYREFELSKYNYEIYQTVKNRMNDEVKDRSTKFMSAVKMEVERVLDMLENDFKVKLWHVWEKTNEYLRNVFFRYFDEQKCSEDGYYYKELDLNNPDEEFIEAMFSANDVQNGQRLSLEVLCNEIVIYTPLNPIVSEKIKENKVASEVFRDNQGNVIFSMLDTRGLYHSENSEAENTDYLNDLLYSKEADALLMVVPLFGDSNERKISELYNNAFKYFSKQIPVFMIHNKLDLFIDSINKELFDDDPLSIEIREEKSVSVDEMSKRLREREDELRGELQVTQRKSRKDLEIKSLSCYLKRGTSMPDEILLNYNILNVFTTVFNDTANYLKDTAVKIPLKVNDSNYEDVEISVNKEKIAEIVKEYVYKDITDKKVYTPGLKDLAKSIGKTPHGNSYNALKRRLKNGDGYTANIEDVYFYNCDSFSINFTGNLRNFVTTEMISTIIFRAVKVNGGKFTQKDEEKFMQLVEKNVHPKKFVSYLLYSKAIQDAEKMAFSFKGKFQNFLQISLKYFIVPQNISDYVEAILLIVEEAAEHTLRMNVTFR